MQKKQKTKTGNKNSNQIY